MGVVKRKGKWRLEKVKKGHYAITHRRNKQAEIVTDEYTPSGGVMGSDMDILSERIEVSDFEEAKRAFESYVDRQESGVSLF